MESLSTLVVHGATAKTPANHPVSLPIYQSASWTFSDLDEVDAVYSGEKPGVIYGRNGTPNHRALENLFARLHRAEAGVACASGMSALSAAFLGLLSQESKVVASQDLYGSTLNVLHDLRRFGLELATVEITDFDRMHTELQGAQMLVLETSSNPRLRIPDLPRLCTMAHQAGAVVLVDNTFASPYHCRPTEHGADIVMESLTKFISGHSDVMIGAVAGRHRLIEPIRSVAVRMGLVSNPHECWLSVRGTETLEVRMQRASSNAAELAHFLAGHSKVRQVHYPGLTSHPDHLTARQVLQNGFAAMLAFELEPSRQMLNNFLRGLGYIKLALSLGGVNTTLSHPATSSHRFLSPDEREKLGLHDGFLRMSVGIENLNDLKSDLEQALSGL
ncbi:PLP-dependent aspartate aminotransferase family protein [uncultured Meiothermus sp.]|jgi:cystathionine gamma-synthase/methionine-gamma-lyase|uniref:trans-sulfuration enzyme family protein n=1 Tax=uncultured Meiothermus sp. TaxID=157471 RepID=UPI00260B9B78|nr:PLP-dependent aspartate aminotransferase family protein [uncultured Meiothermus sp.]